MKGQCHTAGDVYGLLSRALSPFTTAVPGPLTDAAEGGRV